MVAPARVFGLAWSLDHIITTKLSPQWTTKAMSLYYEAAAVLANPDKIGGSLKSRIYKNKDLKSSPAQLFALIAEASKWSIVLKDVLERSNLLAEEKKVFAVPRLLFTWVANC